MVQGILTRSALRNRFSIWRPSGTRGLSPRRCAGTILAQQAYLGNKFVHGAEVLHCGKGVMRRLQWKHPRVVDAYYLSQMRHDVVFELALETRAAGHLISPFV